MSKSAVTYLVMIVFVLLTACNAQSQDVPISAIGETEATKTLAVLIPPSALVATTDSQRIYHIDPNRSSVSYHVNELLLNSDDTRAVVGMTPAVKGHLLIDWATPANSDISEVTVALSGLTSGSTLRDLRIRSAYLDSDTYPVATFIADREAISFPASINAGEAVRFMLPGNLTVRDITRRVTWHVELVAEEEEVHASAELEIQMSDFGVGPISIIGLLETENEMRLTLDLVATVDDITPIAQAESSDLIPTPPTADTPEFFADIEPILAANCVACHATGQIGHGTYAMETARDVIAVADDLAFVIGSGNMPPWPASDDNPPFEHERRLNSAEIALFTQWATAGAPIDGSLDAPLVANLHPFTPLRSDVIMRMPEPYTPKTTIADNYRCYLLDPQLTEDRYMTGFHVFPSNLQVAHHLVSEVGTRSRVQAEVARLEAIDDEPGWACPGSGSGVNSGSFQASISAANALSTLPTWAPGTYPIHFPSESGVLLDKESVFIIQMHYNTAAGTGPDQTELHLQLAPLGTSVQPILGFDMLAPVEIPCPENIDTPACKRGTFKGDSLPDPGFAQALLGMCGRSPDDYLGQSASNVVSDCLYEINMDGEIVIASAHMHELGKAFNITLNPETPHAQPILDIDRWDFDWQGGYHLKTPIQVNKGDTVLVTCIWNNSPYHAETASINPYQNSQEKLRGQRIDSLLATLTGAQTVFAHDQIDPHAYRYVSWGYGTSDEMCIGSLAFLASAGDQVIVPMSAKTPPRLDRIAITIVVVAGVFMWLVRRGRLVRRGNIGA